MATTTSRRSRLWSTTRPWRIASTTDDDSAQSRLRDLWWLTDFADRARAARSPRFADHATDPAVMAALERDWQQALDGIDERLARLTAPALVVHGRADPIGESGPRELAGLLPRGHFASLRGVGHVPWLEDDRELSEHLRAFIVGRGNTIPTWPG